MTAPVRGLHAKLAEVMAEADRIPKNGKYEGQGKFAYVLVGDAADAIRSRLGERRVSMLPSAVDVISEAEHPTKSGGTMTTITIRTTWTLTDGATGETAVIQSIGTGADSGDKASPKAQTNAMKYALLMGFLLSTGDDPEQSDSSDRQQRVTGGETLELLGRIQKSGTLVKGGADKFQGEWRQDPDGHAIGFRFKLAGEDRDIPQVLIKGSIGEALYVAQPELLDSKVTIKGHLYGVRQPGRTTYMRLVVGDHPDQDFIETADWRIPALPDDAGATETPEPVEADSIPMLPLDDEEKALIADGRP